MPDLYFQINCRIRSCLVPLNDQQFPKFVKGLDNGDFLFFKIFQLLPKKATGGLFDYYGIVYKEEK